jgi:hypothetical protein
MFKDSSPSDPALAHPASDPESLQLGERGDMGDYTEQQCSGVPPQADRRPKQRPVWLNKKQMNVEIRLGFGRCRLSILSKKEQWGGGILEYLAVLRHGNSPSPHDTKLLNAYSPQSSSSWGAS